jgi:lysophospholipase L1-like esterase
MRLQNIALLTTFTIFLVGCKPKFDVPDADKGDLDASNYVALGSSMTAGYANGALYHEAQQNSYAYLLAEQLKLVGGGEFKVPFVAESSIGIGNANNAPSKLGDRTDCLGETSLGPVKLAPQGDLSVFSSNVYASQGPFNNFGVPDVKVIDMDVSGYSNPFYTRMASGASSSILSDALARNPTFFTVALGLNDVLNYALKGATADAITPINGPVNVGFEASMNNIIDKLTANGAKGAIANIPSIKTMAYFNTIAWNALKIDAATAGSLTALYANLDPVVPFYEGNNGFIIEDQNMPAGYKQITEGEFVLLNAPLDSIKCYKWGSLVTIPDRYTLSSSEINQIENAINDYNAILKNLADSRGLAFVDMNAFFGKIKTGFNYNGVTINAAFVSGGAYSLDGLNLTPRGNALLANEFIKAINSTYNSSIPHLEATKYPGVIFP